MKVKVFTVVLSSVAAFAGAGVLDRDPGIKFMNERLTLEPYVALSYTYDSNVDQTKNSQDGSQWVVNPGLGIKYEDDFWCIDSLVWYKYHAYNNYSSQLDSSSYGERIKLRWTNAHEGRGWDVSFLESFEQIAQDDNMSRIGGRGMNRDRMQFLAEGVVRRRINERLHAAVLSDYYLLDYDNNVDKYAWLYGWKRLQVGLEGGYTLTRWTDLLLTANYQWYWHDNDVDMSANDQFHTSRRGRPICGDSNGWSIMTGFGTHATEKLTYRVLAGWSNFEYADGASDLDGWTYQVSSDWQLDANNTWHIMALGSSYYQPSEREFGSALKVYNMSFGITKSLIRNKLRAAFDVAYRREAHEYSEYEVDNYDEDIWTARISLEYRINRLLTVFGRVEYQNEAADGASLPGDIYDYDRWRATIGLRMTW